MTRMSKQGERRNKCPKKTKPNLSKKTGPKKSSHAFKEHVNGIDSSSAFIPKMR